MKKLFLTICFSIIGWQIIDASAKTVAFEDMEAAQAYKASQDNLPPPPPEDDSPDPRDTRAMEKYIMERLKKATISNLGPTDSMDRPSSVNMQHSDDYIAKMNEKNKSFLNGFTMKPSTAFLQAIPVRVATPKAAAPAILNLSRTICSSFRRLIFRW